MRCVCVVLLCYFSRGGVFVRFLVENRWMICTVVPGKDIYSSYIPVIRSHVMSERTVF